MRKITIPAGALIVGLFSLLISCKSKDSKVEESATRDTSSSTQPSQKERYSSDYDAPGKMTITGWGNGQIDGSFTVTVIMNNSLEDTRKLIEGTFHYLGSR